MSLFYSFSPFVRRKLFLRKVKFYLRNVMNEIYKLADKLRAIAGSYVNHKGI